MYLFSEQKISILKSLLVVISIVGTASCVSSSIHNEQDLEVNEPFHQLQSSSLIYKRGKLAKGMHIKAVATQDQNKRLHYAYAPEIIKTKDGVYHLLYCGNTLESGADGIRYSRSHNKGKTWSEPVTILHSTNTSKKYHFQYCDPSVIYHEKDKKWYMYLSGSYRDRKGQPFKTLVFLARADSISGDPYKGKKRWQIYTNADDDPWSYDSKAVPFPIIEPLNNKKNGEYGAGQTAVYYDGENIHLWFRDDSLDEALTKQDIQGGDVEGKYSKIYKVTSKGKPYALGKREYTGIIGDSPSIKYDLENNRFVFFFIEKAHRPESALWRRYSYDNGLSWSSAELVCNHNNCFPDYASNIGVSSDPSGNLLHENIVDLDDSNLTMLGYGAPIDTSYTNRVYGNRKYGDRSHARWDLFISWMNVKRKGECILSGDKPMVTFVQAKTNSKLISANNLIDGDLASNYSSHGSDKKNTSGNQVEVWSDKAEIIKSISLHPTINSENGNEQPIAFPKEYDIWLTDSKTTPWKYHGRISIQPKRIHSADGRYRIFSSQIKFQEPMKIRGIRIRPSILSEDNSGNFVFQMAEIRAETFRSCH